MFPGPMFPGLAAFTDLGLLLMRLLVALVFADSGWKHLRGPGDRAKRIGMSTGFTILPGAAEGLGAPGDAIGVHPQLADAGLCQRHLGAHRLSNLLRYPGIH